MTCTFRFCHFLFAYCSLVGVVTVVVLSSSFTAYVCECVYVLCGQEQTAMTHPFLLDIDHNFSVHVASLRCHYLVQATRLASPHHPFTMFLFIRVLCSIKIKAIFCTNYEVIVTVSWCTSCINFSQHCFDESLQFFFFVSPRSCPEDRCIERIWAKK